jgi:hypothetical protein
MVAAYAMSSTAKSDPTPAPQPKPSNVVVYWHA